MSFKIDDFIAGWIGGSCGLVVGHPLDTIKVRQQAYGSNFYEATRRTFKYEGFRGFFKGILFPLVTIGPSNALLFGVYGNIIDFNGTTKRQREHVSYTDERELTRIYIAGTIAGIFQTVFSCPVDLIKTILQAQTEGKGSWKKHYEVPYKGSIDAFRGIIRDRGFKGLFRGLTPLLIRDAPTSGVYILTYETLMFYEFSQCKTPVFLKRFVAGGTAGVLSWVLVFPIDVVKSRIQVDNPKNPKYKGVLDCIIKLYKSNGPRIFFKGAPATIIRTVPVNATVFITYEAILSLFE